MKVSKEAVIDIDGIGVKVAVASGLGNVHFLLEKIRAWKDAGSNPETIPWQLHRGYGLLWWLYCRWWSALWGSGYQEDQAYRRSVF